MEPELSGLISLVLLIGLNALSTTIYSALVGARRQQLREDAEQGNRRAALALRLSENSLQFINTFKFTSLLFHFLTAGIATLLLMPLIAAQLQILIGNSILGLLFSFILLLPALTLVVFLLSEVLPNLLVQRDHAAWATRLARPAHIIILLFSPFVAMITAARHIMAKPLGVPSDGASVTEEEIMTLVDAGQEEGSIEEQEKEMIYSIFQLDTTLAREIMVPRIDMIALDIETSLKEARQVIMEAGHSRIPVYAESLDHIKGLLYAKDLLQYSQTDEAIINITDILRPAQFVPETKRVSELLQELQTAKVHLAIVIDEYGGTAGLVTIEDIVEEIVGEILDEYDEVEDLFEQINDDTYRFDARIDLDDLNRLIDTHLPNNHGEDTLGGFIYGQLGKVPDQNDAITYDDLNIRVVSVADRRIRQVEIIRTPREELGEESNAITDEN